MTEQEPNATPPAAGASENPAMNAQPTPDGVTGQIVDALKTCYDPEIPVDIYELGLIYTVEVNPETSHADVNMTLTSPACPVAGTLPLEVEQKVTSVDGVSSAKVEVVWDPPWNPDMMSESAKLELGF